jgi:hypothetical protein
MSIQEPPKHMVDLIGTGMQTPHEIAKKLELQASLDGLTTKVQKMQREAENERMATVFQRFRDRVVGEPVDESGDLSQEKILRMVDEEIEALLRK